tara:strand:- start:13008 stop:13115 length:108 start_codon:yes stop_codon:yes gene_type:complete
MIYSLLLGAGLVVVAFIGLITFVHANNRTDINDPK